MQSLDQVDEEARGRLRSLLSQLSGRASELATMAMKIWAAHDEIGADCDRLKSRVTVMGEQEVNNNFQCL